LLGRSTRLGATAGGTWIEVEEDVDEILVSPGDVVPVLPIVWHHLLGPRTLAHTCQVHQHYTRVNTYQQNDM